MRKLMWFALGLAMMCAAVAYLNIWWAAGIAMAALAGAILSFLFGKEKMGVRVIRIVCTGLLVGFAVGAVYAAGPLMIAGSQDGVTSQVTALVTDYSFETEQGSAAQVKLELGGKWISAQLYFDRNMDLKPGDRVEGSFRFRYTGGKHATYHLGKGILLLGYQRGAVIIADEGELPLWGYSALLRQRIIRVLDHCFPHDTAFFARALLIGDRTDMDYETNTAFKVTGISHIVAVSGMHVSILAGAVYVLAAKRRWLMAALGIPTVLLFAAIVGFTPSITRACMMQILLLIALVLDRDYDPLTALATAATMMLLSNPLAITSVSFQLSFGCMAGIFLFSSRVYAGMSNWRIWRKAKPKSLLGRIRKWLAGSISITLGAMAFTTPLCAVHFGAVSLVGLLTNLLVLWLIGLIFPGVLIVVLLACVHGGSATAFAGLLSLFIRALLGFVSWLARFPLAAVYTKSGFIIGWIALCYGMLMLFLLAKKRRGRILVSGCVLSLCICLLLSWYVPGVDRVRMTVLDVGQGQSVILRAGDRTFLVDCGGDYDESAADIAAETLLSQGIFRIDGLILTHYDGDHAGGVAYFLSRIGADRVYLPEVSKPDGKTDAILAATSDTAYFVREDTLLEWEDCRLEIFAPVLSNSDNESGISVLFSGGNCDILITGDMNSLGEALLLDQNRLPKLEALVAGHHGSKHSTSEKLLAATMPEQVFISVGADNTYGHPAPEVLERLKAYGCEIHRTDIEGTIVFRR